MDIKKNNDRRDELSNTQTQKQVVADKKVIKWAFFIQLMGGAYFIISAAYFKTKMKFVSYFINGRGFFYHFGSVHAYKKQDRP